MKRLLIACLAFLALAFPAAAQQQVRTIPELRAATDASSTIAVTNTFQLVFAANTNRTGCTIQNNGAATMWVAFKAAADATAATSVVLAPGQAVYCGTGTGIALTNAVSITGTTTQAYYAASW